MSLILTEKYIKKNGSYKLFITNRFLRIYPLYWVILILAFSFSLYKFLHFPTQDNYIKTLLEFLSHSPNFGFEITMTIWRNISLIFTTDYFRHNFIDPGYLLILPAWTLQVELLFYLLAPFIVKAKLKLIIILTLIFSIITFCFPALVSPKDSSITTIFITRFVYFLFGILSYRLYSVIKKKNLLQKIPAVSKAALPIFIIILFNYFIPIINDSSLKQTITFFYYFILLGCIALLFLNSKNNKFDRALGELSYPVYLSHQLVFKILNTGPLAGKNHELITLSCLAATLFFSYLLVKFIETPIDKIRQKMLH